MTRSAAVIWHDLECGGYREDLPLWRELAASAGGRVLDIGAGSGRVSLDLARAGHAVTALDRDPELIEALRERAARDGLAIETVLADARAFALPAPVALAIVPMQTVQLLPDPDARGRLLGCARGALAPGGSLVLAIADALEPFEVDDELSGPLADIAEFDGTVYSSRPTAVRVAGDGFALARRHETVTPDGVLESVDDVIELRALSAGQLEDEGRAAGFTVRARRAIATTAEYVGSSVVVLGA